MKISKFLYDHFNQLENIAYEIDWMIGYSSSKNMQEIDFSQIDLLAKDSVEVSIPSHVADQVSREIGSGNPADIEKAIHLFYLALYVIGGTN